MALGIHTVLVYTSADHLSPWLVYHWFGWIAPILGISVRIPATDWYLQHLEMATIPLAMLLGYLNVTRFYPTAVHRYMRGGSFDSAVLWAWVIPVLVLGYKMLLYRAPSSVLYNTSVSTLNYFFDIQKIMPTRANFRATDPIRVLAQMTVTAPFYAGVAYSLGGLASNQNLLVALFVSRRLQE
jgi:hypothetical protein